MQTARRLSLTQHLNNLPEEIKIQILRHLDSQTTKSLNSSFYKKHKMNIHALKEFLYKLIEFSNNNNGIHYTINIRYERFTYKDNPITREYNPHSNLTIKYDPNDRSPSNANTINIIDFLDVFIENTSSLEKSLRIQSASQYDYIVAATVIEVRINQPENTEFRKIIETFTKTMYPNASVYIKVN